MYTYPLSFEIGEDGLNSDLKLKDAQKRVLLRGTQIKDDALDGKSAYCVYRTENGNELAYQIQCQKQSGIVQYAIATADGSKLGTLATEKTGKWNILSFGGLPVGQVCRKNGWRRSCLLVFLPDVFEAIFYLLFPVRYVIDLNGRTVLKLSEKDPTGFGADGYSVKKVGEFTEMEEALLVGCAIAAFWPA